MDFYYFSSRRTTQHCRGGKTTEGCSEGLDALRFFFKIHGGIEQNRSDSKMSAFFFIFRFILFLCSLGDVAFSEFFVPLPFSLCIGEYIVRFFLPDGVFLPCNYGLDFLRQFM